MSLRGAAIVALATWLAGSGSSLGVELLGPGPVVIEGQRPEDLVVADLDGDGVLDLAVVNRSSESVAILLGDGQGAFTPAPGSPHEVGFDAVAATLGDFDADGQPDLAVLLRRPAKVSILLGEGDGQFGAPREFSAGIADFSVPRSIAAGDLTGNDAIDLAVASPGDGWVRVLAGDGSGAFSEAQQIPLQGSPGFLALADLYGTDTPEIAVVRQSAGTVTILGRDEAGSFQPDRDIELGGEPRRLVIADLDGDGNSDLAVTNRVGVEPGGAERGRVSVLEGDGAGNFELANDALPTGAWPEAIAVDDLDGDRQPDFVVTNSAVAENSVTVYLGRGAFEFDGKGETLVGDGPQAVALADFNGDGLSEMALSLIRAEDVRIFAGTGLGGFEQARGFHVGRWVDFARIAHFNRDPYPDLVTGDEHPYVNFGGRVHLSDGVGGFSVPEEDDPVRFCVREPVYDLDGDGLTDRLDWTGHRLAVAFSGPSGEIQETLDFVVPIDPDLIPGNEGIVCADAADFDADGVLDLFVTYEGDSDRRWYRIALLGKGGRAGYEFLEGFFALQAPDVGPDATGTHPPALLADLNGDGRADYVGTAGNRGEFGSDVRLADETGRLVFDRMLPIDLTSGVALASNETSGDGGRAAFVDVDGDGDVDIVGIAARESDSRTVVPYLFSLLNRGDGTFDTSGWSGPEGYQRLAAADFNLDGHVDLAAVRVAVNPATDLLLGDGTGAFTKVSKLAGADFPRQPDAGDLDGDGLPDLAVADMGSDEATGSVALLYNQIGRRADLNGSNRIDGHDVGALLRLAGTMRDDVGYRANADVNLDGAVDGADLTVVAERFGTVVQTVSPLVPSVTVFPATDPSTVTLQPAEDEAGGDRVRVDVVVHEPEAAVAGATFAVTFDPRTLRFIDYEPGDYLSGGSGAQVVSIVPGVPGRLEVSASRVPRSAVAAGGPANLVSLVFEASAVGESMIGFDGIESAPPALIDEAQVEVPGTDFGGVSRVTISETGGGRPDQRMTINPTELAFGTVDIGNSMKLKLRIANIGFSELMVSDIDVSPADAGFSSFFTSPFTIPPLGYVELWVRFEPTTGGEHSADLVISSDDPASPQRIPLSGTAPPSGP